MSTNIFQNPSPAKPNKRPLPQHNSILESLRDVGSDVGKTVKQDVAGKMANDAFASLFGNFPKPAGEAGRNPWETRAPQPKREAPRPMPEALSPAKISAEQIRVKQQLEQVRGELSALAKSVGQLNMEVQKAIMEVPVDPGVYHVNFFEQLKNALKMLRQSVDDSRTWLSLTGSRKKQKGYWGKYKKHGTQFGLSADRTPATQTG